MVSASGLTPLLRQLPSLEREVTEGREGADIRLVKIQLKVQSRMLLAMAEAARTAGIVRCEQARADELADSLAESRERRSNAHTLTSVIIGGLTDALTGGLGLLATQMPTAIIGMVGGGLQSLFG